VRVIRAARELGLRAIAVYSELDRDALHVEVADEAWNIGPAPAAESYLNMDAIIRVAGESNASAIHPGYGFLAENAIFAQRVIDEGLIWVGPPPAAIALMGDKISSRRAVAAAGVPGVPGTLEALSSVNEVRAAAAEYGFPVAIKAAHGGGGKGLRIARDESALEDAFEAARREADAYFANPEVYLERYLEHPRHIEAQIIIDQHGTAVFLGERDCSLQRRHQKLIEETPSPVITGDQRSAIGDAALAVAAAAGYENAGTVEFLLDQHGDLYFLEMNTRLQVEHTITEMVTGIDLAKEQLRVAMGEPLSFTGVESRGHAIEFRINAEDPARGFLPSPGDIVDYREPGGLGVRVDSGVRSGSVISPYYDNLIAKLVVWGRDRTEAIERSRRALGEFTITGVATTIPFHCHALRSDAFTEGTHHTRSVEEEMDLSHLKQPAAPILPEEEEMVQRTMTVEVGGRRYSVRLWAPELPGAPAPGGARPTARRRPPKLAQTDAPVANEGVITAPMQGTIVKVHQKAGERVEAEEPMFILEAMKMENEVRAPTAGEIVDLRVEPGDKVSAGQVLAIVR